MRTVLFCTRIFHLVTERASAGSEIVSGQTPRSDAVRGRRSELPICVVIPAYNRAQELPRCLASVWAQHPHGPAEVIVVDDHSTDDTAAVAASLGARVIRHTENRGPAEARNTALAATECEWLAFLDSDDEWLPHHLAHLWEIRGEHALVGGAAIYCTTDGNGDRFSGPVTRRPMQFRSPDRLISRYNFFTASGCMLRRDIALALNGFRNSYVADLELWVRVLEQYTGICSPCVTVLYHIHGDQMSGQTEHMRRAHREVARAHLERTGKATAILDQWEATLAWDGMRAALADGDWRAAWRCGPALVANPQRVIGLVSQLWLRLRVRRRTCRVERDGGPSIAVVVTRPDVRRRVLDTLTDRHVQDLSALSRFATIRALIRRPRGLVVADNRLQAALLRLTGSQTVTARAAAGGVVQLDDRC
jgi:hypothetical protein